MKKCWGIWAIMAFLNLLLPHAAAQLAITEAMSEPATLLVGGSFVRGSDWWELTNFGTNAVDLTGCFATDRAGTKTEAGFQGLVMEPRETVVFFRTNNTANEAQFRDWWGACLKPGTRLLPFTEFGLNNRQDGIRLYDALSNLVDRVDFGAARPGVSFGYDPDSGLFPVHSLVGRCDTCLAANNADTGSPGVTCGPVPLRITQQPRSIEACAGVEVVLEVSACGMPRPKYQWLHDGKPVSSIGENHLVIAGSSLEDAGEYRVLVYNGLQTILSEPAFLTLSTNLSPPVLLRELTELEVFEGETARLTVYVCAVPEPQFQWQADGVDIEGATNRTLVISGATQQESCSSLCARIWNELGFTNCCTRLTVSPWPKLEITEVMSAPSSNVVEGIHCDWWELTNRGSNALRLNGLKHSDNYDVEGAQVVTNNLLLLPGESVVFVENMDREAFIRWWGATNLPLGLKVVSYVGYGLNEHSDELYLWSAASEGGARALASANYASPAPPPFPPTCPCNQDADLCGRVLAGQSLWFDPLLEDALFGECSAEDLGGAFRAAESDDVGSPGFAGQPLCLRFGFEEGAITLYWRVIQGRNYELRYKNGLAEQNWTLLQSQTARGSTLDFTDVPPTQANQRLYQLWELP